MKAPLGPCCGCWRRPVAFDAVSHSPLASLEPARYQEAARLLLEAPTYDYIASGAGAEENLKAFRRRRLLPRVLVDVSQVDVTASVMGTTVAAPVLVAPMAVHRLAHAEGELATAAGTDRAGSVFCVAANSSVAIEEIAGAVPQANLWLQVYNWTDREALARLLERAENAGCRAIVPTVNTPVAVPHGSASSGFRLPHGVAPAHFDASPPLDASLTWSYLEWIASRTSLPVVPKGVMRADDARRALDAGARGVIVSNHGGRQLEHCIATLDALPAVAEAVGSRLEVYLDGGIRTGSDVLIAVALGARAVLVGRPILWGLTVAGADGVAAVLTRLRDELFVAAALCGTASVRDLPGGLVVPGP